MRDAVAVGSGSVSLVLKGHGFTGCGKTDFVLSFWVAQRFTAAIEGFLLLPALGAEGMYVSD